MNSNSDLSSLASPLEFHFSHKTAKNRFLKAATTECLSTWDPVNKSVRGIPTDKVLNVYRSWANGGFGVIISGNIMIELDQLEAAGNMIIPPDAPFSGERFEAFQKLASTAKQHGSLFIGQLSHPGRQVSRKIQPNPISASDIKLEKNDMQMDCAKPRAMEEADFKHLVHSFAHAAEYCYKAGFDGVELHAAHGYLLAQFLSPTTNKRTDKYGGPLENRARLIFEIASAIKQRVPESFSLGIKVNSVEFQHGGFSAEDCKRLCVDLESHGFDYVELSGGTYEELGFSHKRESTKAREAFYLSFAEMIVPGLKNTKVYVTGGLRTAGAMIKALETVDGVGLARPACHEFDLAQKILDGKTKGAKEHLLDEQDFVLTAVAAGSQVRLVGHGKDPVDMGKEDVKTAFLGSMQKWGEMLAKDTDNVHFGYVDIEC